MNSTGLINIEPRAARQVNLTSVAIGKIKEFVNQQVPVPAGLRIGVAGGGCSGLSYSMSFENFRRELDEVYDFDGLQIFVDAASAAYLTGCTVDYEETPDGPGFTFENPNAKSACGCGSSFNV